MINKINEILSEWDPINIGYPQSLQEYGNYANRILPIINDKEKLKKYLIQSLDQMGLTFDITDSYQKKDIDNVIKKLIKLNK